MADALRAMRTVVPAFPGRDLDPSGRDQPGPARAAGGGAAGTARPLARRAGRGAGRPAAAAGRQRVSGRAAGPPVRPSRRALARAAGRPWTIRASSGFVAGAARRPRFPRPSASVPPMPRGDGARACARARGPGRGDRGEAGRARRHGAADRLWQRRQVMTGDTLARGAAPRRRRSAGGPGRGRSVRACRLPGRGTARRARRGQRSSGRCTQAGVPGPAGHRAASAAAARAGAAGAARSARERLLRVCWTRRPWACCSRCWPSPHPEAPLPPGVYPRMSGGDEACGPPRWPVSRAFGTASSAGRAASARASWASLNVGLAQRRPAGTDRSQPGARRGRARHDAPDRLVTARQVHGATALAVSEPWDNLAGARGRRAGDGPAGPAAWRARRGLRPGPAGRSPRPA